jgi:hypothetical protein
MKKTMTTTKPSKMKCGGAIKMKGSKTKTVKK